MQWSDNQQAIFDFVADPKAGSAVVEAVAGSGKTTTIVEAMKYLPRGQSVGFFAFNASIAKELKSRVPAGVDCMTLNSLGHRIVMSNLGRANLNASKVRDLARKHIPKSVRQNDTRLVGSVARLVGLAKANVLLPEDTGFEDLAEAHGIDNAGSAARYARVVLRENNADTATIDFDDQLYYPVVYNMRSPYQFEVVFVDEAQDVSPVQLRLIDKVIQPRNGRLIAVGDRRQGIYGFRGADSSSLDKIAGAYNATLLPLTVTYRCPVAVVELAQEYGPEIQAAPGAPRGAVKTVKEDEAQPSPGDLVLCRNNAPLLSLAFYLLTTGTPCTVMGRDIGANLKGFIKGFKAKTVEQLLTKTERWKAVEMAKAEAKDDTGKMSSVDDRAACVVALTEGISGGCDVTEVLDRLDLIYSEGDGAVLSSIHRAKGLEADNVYILAPDLMPSRFARTEAQKDQERNLMYVAFTRARKTLYFME